MLWQIKSYKDFSSVRWLNLTFRSSYFFLLDCSLLWVLKEKDNFVKIMFKDYCVVNLGYEHWTYDNLHAERPISCIGIYLWSFSPKLRFIHFVILVLYMIFWIDYSFYDYERCNLGQPGHNRLCFKSICP